MNVLGIHIGAHDATSCIVVDGELIAAVEEERFERFKHSSAGVYSAGVPTRSIKFCLDKAGLKMKDIDYITVPVDQKYTRSQLAKVVMQNPSFYFRGGVWGGNILAPIFKFNFWDFRIESAGMSYLKQHFGYLPPVKHVDHHLAHAASTFRCSGFEKANIISIDGIGGLNTCLFGVGNGKDIEVIKEIYFPHSLGGLYAVGTDMVGFKRDSEEGFTMGLAAYGQPKFDLSDALVLDKEKGDFKFYESKLRAKMPKRLPFEPIEQIHKDFAASVQKTLEDALISLAKWLYDQTGYKNFCLAGGVALNACANGKLLQQDFVDDIFIQPAAHDGGAILGAALQFSNSKFKMKGSYFGPEYTNEQIEDFLKGAKIKYEKSSDVCGFTAEKLADDKIIGWMQGRTDWGPRALGNRSIIANPGTPKMKDIVNDQVKHRDFWRPFAPSMLDDVKDKYLIGSHDSPYMILSFEVSPENSKDIISTVHVDNTTRPQTVTKDYNERYYELISKFQKQSGIPAVLNTSFNVKGEPMVCSPADAVRTFNSCGLDYLVMGDIILSKK